jgi:hypothetical protein
MTGFRVMAMGSDSCGVTSYNTIQEAREAANIILLSGSSDRVLIKHAQTGRVVWDSKLSDNNMLTEC